MHLSSAGGVSSSALPWLSRFSSAHTSSCAALPDSSSVGRMGACSTVHVAIGERRQERTLWPSS